MGIEMADVFVRMKPSSQWRPGIERDALIAQMGQAIETNVAQSEPSFTQPIQMRFNELLGGAVTDVTLAIFGEDLDQLRNLALAAADAMRGQPGAVDVRVLAPPDVSLIEVRPRPLEAAQLGFSVGEAPDGAAKPAPPASTSARPTTGRFACPSSYVLAPMRRRRASRTCHCRRRLAASCLCRGWPTCAPSRLRASSTTTRPSVACSSVSMCAARISARWSSARRSACSEPSNCRTATV